MTNSDKVSPNDQSMDERPLMPLEAIIENAWKHFNLKIEASTSQAADASGNPQEPSVANSIAQGGAETYPLPWACSPRSTTRPTRPYPTRGSSVSRDFLQIIGYHSAPRPTPPRGFEAHRSFIKDVWLRSEAASKMSGARTSTAVLNPAIPAFSPSQKDHVGRLQREVIAEDDCGFPYCGGLCAIWAPRPANNDNNEAQQPASSSAVQDEEKANIIPSQDDVQVEDIVPNKEDVQFEEIVPGGDNDSVGEIASANDEGGVSLD
ncbi:hypothetical protein EAE96_004398 [Botrytis aclada]|nr:hypothetical protein EAE96_004398 [Botrytis aclada]